MPKPMPGIVGPDGEPMYALSGEHIGAEHLNAATSWTRRAHAALTLEHAASGAHNRGYHAVGAVRLRLPTWYGTNPTDGRIYEGRLFEHDHATFAGVLFKITRGGIGQATITLGVALPSLDYFVRVMNGPQPFGYQVTGGSPAVGTRHFRFVRLSTTDFRIELHGSPATGAAENRDPVPVCLEIYTAKR